MLVFSLFSIKMGEKECTRWANYCCELTSFDLVLVSKCSTSEKGFLRLTVMFKFVKTGTSLVGYLNDTFLSSTLTPCDFDFSSSRVGSVERADSS